MTNRIIPRPRTNDGSTIPHSPEEVQDYLHSRLSKLPYYTDCDEEWPDLLINTGEPLFYTTIFSNEFGLFTTIHSVETNPTPDISAYPPLTRGPIPSAPPEDSSVRTDWLWDTLSVDPNIIGFDVDGPDWLHIYFTDGTLVILQVTQYTDLSD